MEKITTQRLAALKRQQIPIVALTAYDYPTAALVDAAGVDVVLVGDSLANVILGYENTLPVTVEEMLAALRAVRRGVRWALLVADLPFGCCHPGPSSRTVETSIAFLKAGAEAVKLEGGRSRCGLVQSLADAAVPVLGHIGLTPQSVHAMGGYRVQGKTAKDAEALLEDALALEEAGAFALVLEGIPREVATRITGRLAIPTIGIGAGENCDGQILVLADLLGLTVPPPPEGPSAIEGRKPRFVREYLNLRRLILEAVERYAADVRAGSFPSAAETYRLSEAEAAPATAKSQA
ncbi:MAG: 3-methyl-2-oxobutanoate hydroxymethyltransferase [Planctomycetes bacterium]|nr:3-methyl-2-oxobutanoate hydroxymethyltransferase [Planctomycetota bacterium]